MHDTVDQHPPSKVQVTTGGLELGETPKSSSRVVLGIDVGGSNIKGAPVDVESGELVAKRCKIPTPTPASPEAIANVVATIARQFQWTGELGCAFPAVIRNGVALTATNVDSRWIGTDSRALFSSHTGCNVRVINDADAAGLAEVRFGAGRGRNGLTVMLTLGTGIGSALFMDGQLIPNTELGSLVIDGMIAEKRASARVREREELSWKAWAARLDRYLAELEALLTPEVFILGGGVSKRHKKFLHRLSIKTEIVPADLRNNAGIVGAALRFGNDHPGIRSADADGDRSIDGSPASPR